ncbi:MAG: JAB domain-containing protein [Alphaproteobacteria bacterium]|nr:JAB domain-containing protein [Alphaproteobacteria bacterium]
MRDSSEEKPHYLGHRQRLRERFLSGGASAIADYELLEMILFSAKPRGDVKPLAKKLIAEFGSFAKVVTAKPEALYKVDEVGDAAVSALLIVQAATQRLLQEQMMEKPIIQSWTALLDYAKASMAHNKIEEFRIIFLNRRNEVIRDEVQQQGTIDHTPVYVREVVKRALELGAASLILMHNHPSGDHTPSRADIDITQQVADAARAVGIKIHDHIIVSERGHYSFRANALIG